MTEINENWQRLLEANGSVLGKKEPIEIFRNAVDNFAKQCKSPVHVLRRAFNGNVAAKWTALAAIRGLSEAEREELYPDFLRLFPEVLQDCVNQRSAIGARNTIREMPRDWVRSNIELAGDGILKTADYLEFQMLLYFYDEIDPDLAKKAAGAGIHHPDSDIRETSEDYLNADNSTEDRR